MPHSNTFDPEEGQIVRRPRILACYLAVLLIGVLYQVIYFCADDTVERDSVFYIRGVEVWYARGNFQAMAQELISPRNTTAMKYYTAPFYLFVLKTLKCAFPSVSIETLAVFWGFAAGALTIWFTMLGARLVFRDDAAALFAGLLLALHPRFADLVPRALRDMTYLMLLSLVMYLLMLALSRRVWWFSAGAGFFCFAGIICRVEFAALLPALIPVAIWDAAVTRKRSFPIWGSFGVGIISGYVFWTLLIGIPWDFLLVYLKRFVP